MPHGDAEKAIWWNNPYERIEISQYSDAYAKELEKLIDSKAKRKTILAKPEQVKEETKDLVVALKASLQEARTKR